MKLQGRDVSVDTVLAYLRRDLAALPFWVQAGRSTDELRRRADAILADATAAVGTDPSVPPAAPADPSASTARATRLQGGGDFREARRRSAGIAGAAVRPA